MLSSIKYYWRVFLVGVAFIYFGLGGVCLAIFVFPLFPVFIRDKKKCRLVTQNVIKKCFTSFLKILKKVGLINYHFEGLELFEEDYGCLVVANHPTLIDYIFMASCMPRCDSIVKEALLSNFFVKGVIRAAGYISNGDVDHFLEACKVRLDEDGMLLVFPEGTRTRKDQAIKLQRGVANIALRTVTNIRIVSIFCDHPLLTKEAKWYKLPVSKTTYIIKVEEKINIHSYLNRDNLSLNARRLTNDLTVKFNDNLSKIAERTHEFT